MDLETDEIVHSELCKLSVRKKCKNCRSEYERLRKQVQRKRKYDEIKDTRSVAARKRSKHCELFCPDCKDKSKKQLCDKCRNKYNRVTTANSYKAKKTVKLTQPTETSEHVTQTMQSNLQNSPALPEQLSFPRTFVASKRKSIYSDDMCPVCKKKKHKDFCDECKAAYNCAKTKNTYRVKK